MRAAVGDRVDQRRLGVAHGVAGQVLDLDSLGGHAAGLAGAGETILIANDAADLLARDAREFLRRRPRAIEAERRGLEGFRLVGAETAVGPFRLEHGEHARHPVAGQAEFQLFRFVALVLVGGGADGQRLAHRRVGQLIVQPGRDPFGLVDRGDGPAGQFGQAATDRGGVFGGEGGGAFDERRIDMNAAPIDSFERPILPPLRARQRPRPAINFPHRLDVAPGVVEKSPPFRRDGRRAPRRRPRTA